MAKDITLGSFGTLNNSSIIAILNANNTAIENTFEDCLSLSGELPNAMQSNLDMNNNQIINLPAPSTSNSPIRLADASLIAGTQGPPGPAGPTGPQGPQGPQGPASSAWNITDGVHTVNSLTNLTVTGGTVGGSTPNATLTITGGGGGGTAIDLAAAYGLVADGNSITPTDNGPKFLNMMGAGLPTIPSLKIINPVYSAPIPVTISGSPTNIITTYTNATRVTPAAHAMRVADPFVLIAGAEGSLPSNYTPGTILYTANAGMLGTSFKASTTDEFAYFCCVDINGAGLPAPITWTGGSDLYICKVNEGWIDAVLPPGTYSTSTQFFRIAGPRNLRLNAYDATIIGSGNVNIGFGGVGFTNGFFPYRGHRINSVSPGDTSITLQNIADASNFTVGGWLMLGMDEKQSGFGNPRGFPSNMYVFEYLPILSISGATINFGTPYGPNPGTTYYLKNGYLDTMPVVVPNGAIGGVLPLSGPALAYACPPAWDMNLEISGLSNMTSTGQTLIAGRNITVKDCIFGGGGASVGVAGGPAPTMSKMVEFDNVSSGLAYDGTPIIVHDKLIEQVLIRNCESLLGIQIEGSGPDLLTLDNCAIQQLSGTGKNTVIRDCSLPQGVLIGPAFGSTETLTITGSRIGNIQPAPRLDDVPTSGSFGNALHNWSFSDGVISQPFINTIANAWMSLGKSAFINDMAQQYLYMGAPFKINNVYLTYANSTGSTVTVAGTSAPSLSDALVTWTGSPTVVNGDIVSFSDALPTGGQLLPFTPYWVVNVAGTTTKTFNLAAFLNGPNLQVSGTSTSPTLYRNPVYNASTTLTSLPAGSSTSDTVTMSQASPMVVTGTAPVANGTRVAFKTTDTLPAIGSALGTATTCTIS